MPTTAAPKAALAADTASSSPASPTRGTNATSVATSHAAAAPPTRSMLWPSRKASRSGASATRPSAAIKPPNATIWQTTSGQRTGRSRYSDMWRTTCHHQPAPISSPGTPAHAKAESASSHVPCSHHSTHASTAIRAPSTAIVCHSRADRSRGTVSGDVSTIMAADGTSS
ncbi:MAG: hypothetical protein EBZ74_05105 [Planctomycetia bacterium]|nr:hypothetical protein [Planctomycetia bacterium]